MEEKEEDSESGESNKGDDSPKKLIKDVEIDTDEEDDRAPMERLARDSDIRLIKLGATLSMIDLFSLRWSDEHGITGTVTDTLAEEFRAPAMEGKEWQFRCGLLNEGEIVLNEYDYDGREFVSVFLDDNRANTRPDGEGFFTMTPELRKAEPESQGWLTDDDFVDAYEIEDTDSGSENSSLASWNEDMTDREWYGYVSDDDEEMEDAEAVKSEALEKSQDGPSGS